MGKLLRILVRIAEALEAIANRPRTQTPDVADLEARIGAHLLGMQQAITELQTRSPPEADLAKRLSAVESDFVALRTRVNSVSSKVYREAATQQKRRAAAPSTGLLGAAYPPVDQEAEAYGDD